MDWFNFFMDCSYACTDCSNFCQIQSICQSFFNRNSCIYSTHSLYSLSVCSFEQNNIQSSLGNVQTPIHTPLQIDTQENMITGMPPVKHANCNSIIFHNLSVSKVTFQIIYKILVVFKWACKHICPHWSVKNKHDPSRNLKRLKMIRQKFFRHAKEMILNYTIIMLINLKCYAPQLVYITNVIS